tara:strand:- start:1140 stop:1769 length:630 start_codon:yes stop_codon:yes gene_type:complete
VKNKNKNNINKIYNRSKNFAEFSSNYFDYLKKVFQNIDLNSINKIENDFNQLRLRKKTIFVIGNGGAAATAITMANDLGFDILKKTNTKKTFKISSLNDNNSVITAIANDTGYENIFINQLKIHYQKGDALVILSASGNSPNLIKAARWVRDQKGKVIGILGFSGGKVKKYCNTLIHIKTNSGEYGPVEDLQLIFNHLLAHWFQNKIKR